MKNIETEELIGLLESLRDGIMGISKLMIEENITEASFALGCFYSFIANEVVELKAVLKTEEKEE